MPVTKKQRPPDRWKVRWCGQCRAYEYDSGAPRGWIPLRGTVPGSWDDNPASILNLLGAFATAADYARAADYCNELVDVPPGVVFTKETRS